MMSINDIQGLVRGGGNEAGGSYEPHKPIGQVERSTTVRVSFEVEVSYTSPNKLEDKVEDIISEIQGIGGKKISASSKEFSTSNR
jgi:uncharacterized spore protein YtfJ